MKNIDELLGVAKLSELMSNDKKDESKKVLWVLAIIGAVAAVVGDFLHVAKLVGGFGVSRFSGRGGRSGSRGAEGEAALKETSAGKFHGVSPG